jgi:putative membrane protein
MVTTITERMRQSIEATIAAAEKSSRAELVAVVAKRAGEYRATGLSLATLGSFIAGFAVWLVVPWSGTAEVLMAEFAVFLVLLGFLELTPLGDRLTPEATKADAARRLARATFLEQGLAGTAERSAVLFFVSLAERHVEIIADKGIDGKVSAAQWQVIVDKFSAHVRAGQVEEGYLAAIAALGQVLATHFPSNGPRRNELGNRLIDL